MSGNERKSVLGSVVVAALSVCGAVVIVVGLSKEWMAPGIIYDAECVKADGSVVMTEEYVLEEDVAEPIRVAPLRAGETSPSGYSIVSVDEEASGQYSVEASFSVGGKPRVFENVPVCPVDVP